MLLIPPYSDFINGLLNPKTVWSGTKTFCDLAVSGLGESLRINDESGDGVLFVNCRTLHRSDDDRLLKAAIARSNLENKIGFSYAIFNSRNKPIGSSQIISFESPLLRLCSGSKLLEALDSKCDLVSYDSNLNKLTSIEVMLHSKTNNTGVRQGVLQAISYYSFLRHCLLTDPDGLENQVQMCLNKWCQQNVSESPVESIACALAAPKSYFRESFDKYGESVDWIRKVVQANDAPSLSFWVLEFDEIKEGIMVSDSHCIPEVDCQIRFFSSVDALADYCC